MARISAKRIDAQPSYILHQYAYSETSLVVEVFSRDYGRVAMLARGARRPRSVLRGSLMAFQPLELDWFGGGEVKTLAKAEWLGGMPLLTGRSLLLAYYLNELLLKMLPREDAHASLFAAYVAALHALAQSAGTEVELRRFELALLKELGYGLSLEREAESGAALQPELEYVYRIERGPILKVGAGETDGASAAASVVGKTLLDMAADDFSDARTRRESRQLMRESIAHHLGDRSLQSRRIFLELQEL
ncbi:MAG TPA: DNA repair protein RecO [Rhodocyclaceae bacterium]|nr:DNA repair protein RecO [Rhodocyclaceae bacterium]